MTTDEDLFEFVPETTPKGWEAGLEVGADGGTVTSGPVDEEIRDWNDLLRVWNLSPDVFEVVEPVTFKAWDGFAKETNADGTQKVVSKRLYSYRARIQRLSPNAISDEIVKGWQKKLIKSKISLVTPSVTKAGTTYLMAVADAQIGKKGTDEAVANWRGGVVRHMDRIERLIESGYNIERIIVAFQGDEHEQVANNYCVAADELILTSDMQWVPAGKLGLGDSLYGVEEHRHDVNGRKYNTGIVTHHEVVVQNCIRLNFSDGTTLTCTPDHPVLARRVVKYGAKPWKWVEARFLAESNYEVAKTSSPWSLPFNEFDRGWMAGMLDGEGSLSGAFSTSQGKPRSAPYHLSVAQKAGTEMDRMQQILLDNNFATTRTSGNSSADNLHILGGYSEIMRALGCFPAQRLLRKLGHPYMRTRSNVTVVSVDDVGPTEIASMTTSNHTYIANGIVSHNTNQPYTVELNLSSQIELDFSLRVWTIEQAAALGIPVLVTSVISNHGEWTRNGGKDVVTSKADNSSTSVCRLVKQLFDKLPAYEHVTFNIAEDNPDIVLWTSGVQISLSHGHIAKGRGSGVEQKTKNAIDKQILGRTAELVDCRVFIVAHYHHLYMIEDKGRTLFGCPALEAEGSSEYMKDQYGVWSKPGMLGLLLGDQFPLAWAEMEVL